MKMPVAEDPGGGEEIPYPPPGLLPWNMQNLSMVKITVEIFGSEIEQKLYKGHIFQFS